MFFKIFGILTHILKLWHFGTYFKILTHFGTYFQSFQYNNLTQDNNLIPFDTHFQSFQDNNLRHFEIHTSLVILGQIQFDTTASICRDII